MYAVLLACFNRDPDGLGALLADVPREGLADLIATMAESAITGWVRAAGNDADAVRRVIASCALDLATQ